MHKKIIKKYLTKYNIPLLLKKGDVVVLGEEEKEEKWKGWIWATHEGISAWIPKQIVSNEDGRKGIIAEPYSSKELDVNEGDTVIQLKKLNGWLWVKRIHSEEEGWIPEEVTIDSND